MSADRSDRDRETKLAQALRANLRRRKAPRPAPEGQDERPAKAAAGPESAES